MNNEGHFESFLARSYFDVSAERNALAYCLDGWFDDACSVLDSSDFTDAKHKAVWEAMEAIKGAGSDIDLMSVAEALDGRIDGDIRERVKLVADIASAADYTSGNGRAAVPFVRELSLFRQMKEVFINAATAIDTKVDPDKVLSGLIDGARAIQNTMLSVSKLEGEIGLSNPIPEPLALVERGEDEILHLGDVQMIDGQSKSGKSSICSAIAAATLGGNPDDCLGFSGTVDGAKVLWIDTEQHPRNTALMARRILRAAGFATNENNPRLAVLSWRGKTPTEQERLFFRTARRFRPQLIVLDGVTDIVGDFNDLATSTTIVTRLMALATELDCSILSVLHLNPQTTKGAVGKATGMLGSILYKKVSVEIRVSAEDDAKDARREVRFLKARNGNPEKFWFVIDDYGPHLTSPAPATTGNVHKVRRLIESVLSAGEAVPYSELVSRIMTATGRKDRSAKEKIRIARESGILKESAAKTLYYENAVPDYDEDLPL